MIYTIQKRCEKGYVLYHESRKRGGKNVSILNTVSHLKVKNKEQISG